MGLVGALDFVLHRVLLSLKKWLEKHPVYIFITLYNNEKRNN